MHNSYQGKPISPLSPNFNGKEFRFRHHSPADGRRRRRRRRSMVVFQVTVSGKNRYSDEKVSRFCPWDAFTTREAAIERFLQEDVTHPWHKTICLSGRPVGSIFVNALGGSDRCRAEIGYVIASDYWGRGVGTLAVKKAAKAVFEEWGHLVRLEAVVDVGNTASQRVLEKAGFQREAVLRKYFLLKGTPRDAVIFSLLAEDVRLG